MKNSIKMRLFVGVFVLAMAVVCQAATPKYIFLFIGDGMGSPQRTVAEIYKREKAKVKPGDQAGMLQMNQFPHKCLTTTFPKFGIVTDSAAAATAIACGEKTLNGIIGMKANRKTKLKSIAYIAKEKGKKVAIISTAPLDHATPAAFYANQPSRGQYYEIASQLAGSGFDYFAGTPLNGKSKGQRKGRPCPLAKARKAGYVSYRGVAGREIKPGEEKIIWEVNVPYIIKDPATQVSLAELVARGIEVLGEDKGFFMMAEGGRIDWMGHANDLAINIRETLALDQAVKVAYDFYLKHPDETLIIVTGDHETGGMKIAFSGGFAPAKFVKTVDSQKISGKGFHNKIKAWKKKKASEEEIYNELLNLFPFDDLSDTEKAELKQSITYTVYPEKLTKKQKQLNRKNLLFNKCQAILARRCGVTWTTFGHSSAAVPTTAIGVGAEEFKGKIDNTDIYKKLNVLVK